MTPLQTRPPLTRALEELLPDKPDVRLRIYVYTIEDDAHQGQVKVGQTTGDVKTRVQQQTLTANVQNYTIRLDKPAERHDGSLFSDREVRSRLSGKGFKIELNKNGKPSEWVHCSLEDVQTVIAELGTGEEVSGTHHETFSMRPEQVAAVEKTMGYFTSIWAEDDKAVPRFLWNAKMRFGKTFTSYQLAKSLDAKRVLVVTFKPAVEDAWQTDLDSHADFDGWQYLSIAAGSDPSAADPTRPLVYFGSFQDLLGRDKMGNIKAKNEWLHTSNWDLVVFDEYHYGAWRDNAKELFEGEDAAVAKKEIALEYGEGLEAFDEELDELGNDEIEFLPITTKAYLYLSGTPFKALASGEFIEEQIFNWTYTDEQRAKQEFSEKNPDKWNPYAALPEMRLFTYQMPDELVAVANQGEFDEFDLNAFFEASGSGVNAEFVFKNDVQKWLDIVRGAHMPTQVDALKVGARPPLPIL